MKVVTKSRVVLANALDRVAEGAGDTGTGALGGGASDPRTTSETDGARQLVDQVLPVGFCKGDASQVVVACRVLDVLVDIEEPALYASRA